MFEASKEYENNLKFQKLFCIILNKIMERSINLSLKHITSRIVKIYDLD